MVKGVEAFGDAVERDTQPRGQALGVFFAVLQRQAGRVGCCAVGQRWCLCGWCCELISQQAGKRFEVSFAVMAQRARRGVHHHQQARQGAVLAFKLLHLDDMDGCTLIAGACGRQRQARRRFKRWREPGQQGRNRFAACAGQAGARDKNRRVAVEQNDHGHGHRAGVRGQPRYGQGLAAGRMLGGFDLQRRETRSSFPFGDQFRHSSTSSGSAMCSAKQGGQLMLKPGRHHIL